MLIVFGVARARRGLAAVRSGHITYDMKDPVVTLDTNATVA
jgi:hypothetical protein